MPLSGDETSASLYKKLLPVTGDCVSNVLRCAGCATHGFSSSVQFHALMIVFLRCTRKTFGRMRKKELDTLIFCSICIEYDHLIVRDEMMNKLILEGLFSAVAKPIFASAYSYYSTSEILSVQHLCTFATLQTLSIASQSARRKSKQDGKRDNLIVADYFSNGSL